MNATINMSQKEIEAALRAHLKTRGVTVNGDHAFSFRYDAGDAREPGSGTSVSIQVTLPEIK